MDKQTVFVKTREGEEAVRQRTRLVQRNLRNMLIMVDGKATVEELSMRFGDRHVAEMALAELLAGGFVTEVQDSLDSGEAPPSPQGGAQTEDVPVLTDGVIAAPAVAGNVSVSAPAPAGEGSAPSAPEYASLPPPPLPPVPPQTPSPPAVLRPLDKLKALFFGAQGSAAAASGREQAGRRQTEEEGSEAVEPAPRGRRRFGFLPLLVGVVVAVAVLLGLTLLLYPYRRHLPDIERNASLMLQAPVKVGSIGLGLLPRPHLVLGNVTAGGQTPFLDIAAVRVTPELLSLLGGKMAIGELDLENVAVDANSLARLARASAAPPAMTIRRIRLDNVTLSVGGKRLAGFSGEASQSAAATVTAIDLTNADGSLVIRLQPHEDFYRIAARGEGWKLPFDPALIFPRLEAEGELRADRLALGKIDAQTFDGLLTGKVFLDWSDGARLDGELQIKHMNAAKLLAGIGSDLVVEAELDASLRLAAKATALGRLVPALHAVGIFEMGRGTARRLDLIEAARASAPVRGGETKFEQLSGTFECDPLQCRLDNLRLVSGLLSAGGQFTVARDGPLSGGIDVELKSSAARLRMPLVIGGSAKDPLLTPGRRR
jgi:hypothetical protein